mgnify:CR=1 FL=1
MTINWGGTEFRMAPAVAAAIAFAAVAVILGVWRLIGIVFDWPGAMSHWRRERRRKAGYLALARGMVAVAAGDAREARRHQARAKAAHDEPLLAQLDRGPGPALPRADNKNIIVHCKNPSSRAIRLGWAGCADKGEPLHFRPWVRNKRKPLPARGRGILACGP